VSAFEAIAAATAAGVKLTLDGDGIIVETETPPLPADVVEALRAVKSDLMRVLEWREAAKSAFDAKPPSGARADIWTKALRGLHRFVWEGWADRAALMGWTKAELYRLPPVWARVDLTGAALLIADRKVIAVSRESIAIRAGSGSTLKFYRIGRERRNCPARC
jgi:hypothetical protein